MLGLTKPFTIVFGGVRKSALLNPYGFNDWTELILASAAAFSAAFF